MSKRDKKEENDKFSIYILLRFVCSWHFEVKRRVKWLGSVEMPEQPPQPRRVLLLGQLCDCASTLLMVSMSNISRDAFGTLHSLIFNRHLYWGKQKIQIVFLALKIYLPQELLKITIEKCKVADGWKNAYHKYLYIINI